MRKQKLTSIMITSLLILSTIAFITIPIASATPSDYFETEEAAPTNTIAEWTIDEQKFGDWSAHLLATDFVSPSDYDAARVVIPVSIDFVDIESLSYWFKYSSPPEAFAFPYLIFSIDTDDTPLTIEEVVVMHSGGDPYEPAENTWIEWDLETTTWNQFFSPTSTPPLEFQTLEELQAIVELQGTVVAVKVAVGEGWAVPTTGYVDDIEINGVNYPLEPIVLDKEYYNIGGTVKVTVADIYANVDPMALEEVTVTAVSITDTTGDTITLTETGAGNTGIFVGYIHLIGAPPADRTADEIVVSPEDTITVEYVAGFTDTADIDETIPVFTSVTGPDFCKNEDLVTLTATLTETGLTLTADFSNIDSKYTIGDEDFTEGGGGTYTITYMIDENNTRSDSEYFIPVTAKDGAGNTATWTEFSTTLDNTAPSVTEPTADPSIIQPADPTDVTFTASVSDALSGVASVKINLTSINGDVDQIMLDDGAHGDGGDGDGIYGYVRTSLSVAEGTYTLPITATDVVGNENDLAAITLQVVTDTEGPYEVGFTDVEPICGGLIIHGLYAEDLLTGVKEYKISMNGTTVWAIITEADLTSTTWTTDGNYGVFQRVAVLAGYAGKYVNITVSAFDMVDNESNETILYVGVIPEGEWCPVVLQPKWNLISLPLIPTSSARVDVLSLVLKQGVSGVIITHGYNQLIDDWDTNPLEMTDGWGYWLYVLEYDVLIVQGTETPTPPAMPPTYLFTEGWVLAGFKSTAINTIENYIGSLELASYFPYVYVWDASLQNWKMLDTTSESLNPGEGFWIWMYEDQYLIPPI